MSWQQLEGNRGLKVVMVLALALVSLLLELEKILHTQLLVKSR